LSVISILMLVRSPMREERSDWGDISGEKNNTTPLRASYDSVIVKLIVTPKLL